MPKPRAVPPNLPANPTEIVFQLPRSVDADGVVTVEFELTQPERNRIHQGARVMLHSWTNGHPVYPMAMELVEE